VSSPIPLLPNPGGQLDPANIFGRDVQIAEYWQTLSTQSLYVNDLRRIGKTQIMVKMHAQPPEGWCSIHQDMEEVHNTAELAAAVVRDSIKVLGKGQRSLRTVENLLGKIGGLEIAGILKLPDGQTTAPWKEVITRTFADLEEQMTATNQRVVFFWDEVPYLLDNIAANEGARTAMELLDVLRAVTQKHKRVRLFLTGSIGLHHVLEKLHGDGYIGSPLNHMAHRQPGPLEETHALHLAGGLLRGSAFAMADEPACTTALAGVTGNVAFYIHKLASRLPKHLPLDPELIDATLVQELVSENDDWDFAHYRRRLTQYYRGDREKAALRVLDTVALAHSADFARIRHELNSQQAYDDEDLRSLLTLLCRDHYLVRMPNKEYRFYLEIIRRWWELSRNL
jgi:hypothetical protein